MELKEYLNKLNTVNVVDPTTGHQSLYTIYKGASFEKLKEKMIAKKLSAPSVIRNVVEARSLTVPLLDGNHICSSDAAFSHVIDVQVDQPNAPFYRGGQGRKYATLYFLIGSDIDKRPVTGNQEFIKVNVTATDRWNFTPTNHDVASMTATPSALHECSTVVETSLVDMYKQSVEPEPELAMKHFTNPVTGETLLSIERERDPVTGETTGLSVDFSLPIQQGLARLSDRLSANVNPNLMKGIAAVEPTVELTEEQETFKAAVKKTLDNPTFLEKSFTHEDNDGKHYAIFIGGLKYPGEEELGFIINSLKDDKWSKIEASLEPGAVAVSCDPEQWLLFTTAPMRSPKVSDDARRNELIVSALDYIDHQLKNKDMVAVMTTCDPSTNQEIYAFDCSALTLPDDKGLDWINKHYQERGWSSMMFTDSFDSYVRGSETSSAFAVMCRPLEETRVTQNHRYETIRLFVDHQLSDSQVSNAAAFSVDYKRHEMRFGFSVYAMILPEVRGIERLIKYYKELGWKDAYFTDSLTQRHYNGQNSAMYFVLVEDTKEKDLKHEQAEKEKKLREVKKQAEEEFPEILELINHRLKEEVDVSLPFTTLDENRIPYSSKFCDVDDLFKGEDWNGIVKGMLIQYFQNERSYDYVEFVKHDPDMSEDDKLYMIVSRFDI